MSESLIFLLKYYLVREEGMYADEISEEDLKNGWEDCVVAMGSEEAAMQALLEYKGGFV